MIDALIAQRLQQLGLPEAVDVTAYPNVAVMIEHAITVHKDAPAVSCMGQTLSFRQLDTYADHFAAYLQQCTPLKAGDRIALQLPNILQYPIAFLAAMRLGLIVVNVNPLYTINELNHQFRDADIQALVVLANVAHTSAKVLQQLPVATVIVTEVADLHPWFKRTIIHTTMRYLKRMVPTFSFKHAVSFRQALRQGSTVNYKRPATTESDIAVLQYTGGTTGLPKGVMLTHSNLIANAQQVKPFLRGFVDGADKSHVFIQPLPLYHIYAFTVNTALLLEGVPVVLIPNPRDLNALVNAMRKQPFMGFAGLNTLFVALCNHKGFRKLSFKHLQVTLSGGMALTASVAKQWQHTTGCDISEAYGLSETSPAVTINPPNGNKLGTIGIPVPLTRIALHADDGSVISTTNEPGELCVHGPQVMKGYWRKQDATNKVLQDGWFHTGDIAMVDDDGYLRIVDRKKDMIVISGFKVYPNEIENTACEHPKVLEAAAIGIPSERTGESLCLFVVCDPNTTKPSQDELLAHFKQQLTAYKTPETIVFCDSLPKSNIGKVLRRQLRDTHMATIGDSL